MKDITIIIPIVEPYSEKYEKDLETAVKSIGRKYPVIYAVDESIAFNIKKGKGDKIIKIKKNAQISDAVNAAVTEINTEFFSILEFQDRYNPTWFDNFEKYFNFSGEDISIYLPLTMVSEEGGSENSIMFLNEAFWASAFSNEIGFMDNECLNDFSGFGPTGGIYKIKDFIEVGMLKTSMKSGYWYEFMLRTVHDGKKVFIIPKLGYNHLVIDNSIDMTTDEYNWWMDLAKKEYFFKKDRNKQYQKS